MISISNHRSLSPITTKENKISHLKKKNNSTKHSVIIINIQTSKININLTILCHKSVFFHRKIKIYKKNCFLSYPTNLINQPKIHSFPPKLFPDKKIKRFSNLLKWKMKNIKNLFSKTSF